MGTKTNMMLLCLLSAVLGEREEWKAETIKNIDALVSSCVVIPCKFSHPKENLPGSNLRGIWHFSGEMDARIYHEDVTNVMSSFKGRTRLLGDLGEGNCSLEIQDINKSQSQPICFRIELARTHKDTSTPDKYSFVEDCVNLNMISEPKKPTLIPGDSAILGRHFILTCSALHTCPTHPPTIVWSRGSKEDTVVINGQVHSGVWQVQSILTVHLEEDDDQSDVTCTVNFNGGKTSTEKFRLHLKRPKNSNHIIIPVAVGAGTFVMFAVLLLVIWRRYRNRIAELQRQEGSFWNRISRYSRRIRSRRREQHENNHRRTNGDAEDAGQRASNVTFKSNAEQKISKPRLPSPKSQPRFYNAGEELNDDDDYENTANIYNNSQGN